MRHIFLHFLVLLLLTFVLFFFESCRKDKTDEFYIEGIITDKSSGKAVGGVEFVFSASKISSGVYSSNYEQLVALTTDSDGKYSTSIKLGKVASYMLSLKKNNYFEYEEILDAGKFLAKSKYKMDYSIIPHSFVKIRAKNTQPHDSTDLISYGFTNNYLNCYLCCNNLTHKGHGKHYDSTFVCKAEGGSKITLSWHIHKANQHFTDNKIINCIPFDTVGYEIFY